MVASVGLAFALADSPLSFHNFSLAHRLATPSRRLLLPAGGSGGLPPVLLPWRLDPSSGVYIRARLLPVLPTTRTKGSILLDVPSALLAPPASGRSLRHLEASPGNRCRKGTRTVVPLQQATGPAYNCRRKSPETSQPRPQRKPGVRPGLPRSSVPRCFHSTRHLAHSRPTKRPIAHSTCTTTKNSGL